jgi:Uma2 family endonuclease
MLAVMSAPLHRPMTLAEFLAWEERQDLRWEFDGFAPVAMTGGTFAHGLIAANIIREIGNRLAGSPCRVVGDEVKVQAAWSVRYPDAFVVCSPVDPRATLVHDPVVVFEVLSDSTAATDRFAKNREYEATPSVRRYVMLEQDRIGATVFARESGGWLGRLLGEADTLAMPEIGVSLKLAALYGGLDLPAPPGEAG